MQAQVQDLTQADLRLVEGLGIQGENQKVYLYGEASSVVRVDKRGGDLITTADGKTWLVTQVLERWPDWTAVLVTLQTG